MKKLLTLAFLFAAVCLKAQNVTGFWQTFYDGRMRDPKSVIAVYNYDGKVYARVILMYKEGSRGAVVRDDMYQRIYEAAANVSLTSGKTPVKIGGLDVIWNMQPGRGRTWLYEGGFILDPIAGNDYRARLKIDRDGNLVVRGHLRISSLLGRSHTARKFDTANFPAGFKIPDYKSFIPDAPMVH